MNASDGFVTSGTFRETMRAEIVVRRPSGDVERFDLPIQTIEYTFNSLRFDPGSIIGGQGCQCPLCQAGRGEMVNLPFVGTPPDDVTAYTSLRALLATSTPYEVSSARIALRAGKMHGMSPEHCLLAVIAQARGMDYEDFRPDVLERSPIESWVMAHITTGMTPANDAHAALLDSWLVEWIEARTLEMEARPALAAVAE